jgi:hypothetical protein
MQSLDTYRSNLAPGLNARNRASAAGGKTVLFATSSYLVEHPVPPIHLPVTTTHQPRENEPPRCPVFFLWHQKSPTRAAAGPNTRTQSSVMVLLQDVCPEAVEGGGLLGDVTSFALVPILKQLSSGVRTGTSRGLPRF